VFQASLTKGLTKSFRLLQDKFLFQENLIATLYDYLLSGLQAGLLKKLILIDSPLK